MSRKTGKNLIAGLDVGTSKVTVLVGEITNDGVVDIIGIGTCPSKGLRKGVVVDIESTVQAIKQAVEEAEMMAGCSIHSVYTGITGNHINSLNSHGIVAIRDSEVTPMDVERVIDAAKAVAIPADQKILHILPQEFVIDKQEGIHEPVGMTGVRLESRIHMVTGAVSSAQNIIKCVRRCGLEVDDIILGQLASSYSILSYDEKELGVCLLDIGAGTTDVAAFTQGAIRHTSVKPIAGDQVTNDIAVALRTSTHNAEDIKVRYGCALVKEKDQNEILEVARLGDREVTRLSKAVLAEVIEPRYEELFKLVRSDLDKAGLSEFLGSGIVLTGGAAKTEGIAELAEKIFGTPVRVGMPSHVTGMTDVLNNTIYSTAVGLLLYGQEQMNQRATSTNKKNLPNLFGQVKRWFGGI